MKVLIISHPPATTKNNMGKTFLSLFSQFEQDELCQLYVYPSIPDVDRMSSYYRVTDKEALVSVFTRRKIGGEIPKQRIREDQGMYEVEGDETLYRSRKNKSAVRRLARDAMWSMSRWYNSRLAQWLDREAPTCIFVAPGVAKFAYNIALRISRERKIPIITYLCDEYYFVKEPESMLDKLRLRLLRSKIEELMKKSSRLIAICKELEESYAGRFRIPATTLMTGAGYPVSPTVRVCEHPEHISYFGNIRGNRFVSLEEIGWELDRINREKGTNFRLRIYTAEKNPDILDPLAAVPAIELCKFVTGKEFDRVFHESQLLLHTEAFDEASVNLTQHSVSTKIADSLSSGIPLLAYGPAEIASMGHLIRNRCAITATSKETLRAMLLTGFFDRETGIAAAEAGLAVARQMHDSAANGNRLREIAKEISRSGRVG